jgi:sugar lactone lactonase YvrE
MCLHGDECGPAPVEFTLINQWEGDGSVAGKFLNPIGIALDSAGNVYVADTGNNRIQKFDKDGVPKGIWGAQGSGDAQFDQPTGVAVDGEGNVFVADYGNNLIKKFDSNGDFKEKWGQNPDFGPLLDKPFGVAALSDGRVVATSQGSHQVMVFTSTGRSFAFWGEEGTGEGEFDLLQGVAVDSQDMVYVADHAQTNTAANQPEIQKFSPFGIFSLRWGTKGSDPGQFRRVSGIAIDADDNVYVTDPDFGRFQKFTSTGKNKTGSAGDSPGPGPDGTFDKPSGIAVAPDGTTYVVDTARNHVLVFRQDPM